MALQSWYNSMTNKQRLLVWVVSVIGIAVYGVGIATSVLLAYLHFGAEKSA